MSSLVSPQVARRPLVPPRRQAIRVPKGLVIAGWVLGLLIRICVVIGRSPVLMFLATLAVLGLVAGQRYGVAGVMAGYCWLTSALLGVWLWCPPFYRFARARWRRFAIYRHKWMAVMDFAGLNFYRMDGTQTIPVLGRVACTDTVDRVRAKMLTGQVIEDWAKVSERFCQTFGAVECRVASVPKHPHHVDLVFITKDPLAYEVEPCYATDDLGFLPVARQEDGEWYKLPLLGNHLLVVGATDAGKSSVLWAIINQLRVNIARGTVQVWALDPKGGAELAFGAKMFHRFVYGDDEADPTKTYELAFALVLEEAVAVMRGRQSSQLGVSRLHSPTTTEPLIVLIVDELAALTSYLGNGDAKKRIANALNLLLSQGRAFGITVLGAIQDPRKETLPSRELFPVRILLRVTEALQVDLVFGPDIRDRGARADKIPFGLPGVGFVLLDGVPEAVRVRFAHMTDYRIHQMVAATPLPLSTVPAFEEDAA